MRLRLLANGNVSMTQIGPLEAGALMEIPAHADPSGIPEAESRLFQKPIIEDAGGEFEETKQLEEDWAELVIPDLKTQFHDALERVRLDLKSMAAESPRRSRKKQPDEEPPATAEAADSAESAATVRIPPTLRLTIPAAHVEDWFRAMNQARLVMAERQLWVDDRTGTHGPLLMRIYYETYTALQGWLLDFVMR